MLSKVIQRIPHPGIRTMVRKTVLSMFARRVQFTWPGGVVSFTFDDFPKTSLSTGGSILESYAARGTYYASLKLAGTERNVGPMFNQQDIVAAQFAGHEIACHTFSHLDCRRATRSSILAEVRDNAAALSSLVEGYVPTNFAYPYGSVSLTAKRALGAKFSSCRGIRPGINYGTVDLAELLAVWIYSVDFNEAGMRRLIDRTKSVGGWLIFFTHDVDDVPSRFGCKPIQLEAVVSYASKGTAILPVRDVIKQLRGVNAKAQRS
jgi:peptidoglycan/xylan/chitin deacetylase (PgdA/CDA1 family)